MLFWVSLAVFGETNLRPIKDWSQAARYARDAHIPIIVLYTAQACGYCERLKQEVLRPLFEGQASQPPVLVREVDINTGGKMIDFDGEPIRCRQFKQRYHVFATPTLLILDTNGEPLTEPIVGYDSKEQYQSRLEQVLAGFRI
jgi:thioredoxin-related protein